VEALSDRWCRIQRSSGFALPPSASQVQLSSVKRAYDLPALSGRIAAGRVANSVLTSSDNSQQQEFIGLGRVLEGSAELRLPSAGKVEHEVEASTVPGRGLHLHH
jgi:hypothetical protein